LIKFSTSFQKEGSENFELTTDKVRV